MPSILGEGRGALHISYYRFFIAVCLLVHVVVFRSLDKSIMTFAHIFLEQQTSKHRNWDYERLLHPCVL